MIKKRQSVLAIGEAYGRRILAAALRKKYHSDCIILNNSAAFHYDFYSLSMVRREGAWLFEAYSGRKIIAQKWNGEKYDELCEFDKEHFRLEEFRVRPYYKAQDFGFFPHSNTFGWKTV